MKVFSKHNRSKSAET